MSDSSEEKTLPATDHKLRKAREKGQVATSADFVGGVTVVTTLVYLVYSWPAIVRMISDLLNGSIATMERGDPVTGFAMLIQTFNVLSSRFVVLGFILLLVATMANIVHKQGIPFSMHPIKPDFSRINPGAGLKKMFSMRHATDFGVALLRLTIWFTATGMILWFSLAALMRSVACGMSCVLTESLDTGRLLLIAAVVMLIVWGLVDLPLQVALFRRDQRMSHSEAKRERKDTMGNAEFKAKRREDYRGMLDPSGGGAGTSFYLAGPGFLVGISYNPEQNPLPRVVSRIREAGYDRAIEKARKDRIPVVRQPGLAADIFRTIDVGNIIRERHFERVAAILIELGLVGGGR